MVSGHTGNVVPGNRLRVRLPCPPLRKRHVKLLCGFVSFSFLPGGALRCTGSRYPGRRVSVLQWPHHSHDRRPLAWTAAGRREVFLLSPSERGSAWLRAQFLWGTDHPRMELRPTSARMKDTPDACLESPSPNRCPRPIASAVPTKCCGRFRSCRGRWGGVASPLFRSKAAHP